MTNPLDWLMQHSGLAPSSSGLVPHQTGPTGASFGQPFVSTNSDYVPTSYGDEHRTMPSPYAMSRSSSQQKPTGPTTPTNWDYLNSLGYHQGDFSGNNLPEAPDLTSMVGSAYAPQLKFLRRSIGRTKREGAQAGEKLGDIFAASGRISNRAANRMSRSGKHTVAANKLIFNNLANQRNQEIDKTSSAIARRARSMGVGPAIGAASTHLGKEAAREHRAYAREEGRGIEAARQNAQGWGNLARMGVQANALQGSLSQADLASNMQDAIFGLRGQIASTKSDKAQAMMNAQGQEYQMAMDRANQENALQAQKAGYLGDYMQLQQQQAAGKTDAAGNPIQQEGSDLVSQILGNTLQRGDYQHPGQIKGNLMDALGNLVENTPQQMDPVTKQPIEMTPQSFYSQVGGLQGFDPDLLRALAQKRVYDAYY